MKYKIVSFILAVLIIITMPIASVAASIFSDVPDYSYYHDAVYWAYNQGITTGTSSNTFSPNNNLTRAQVVTFLWKLAGGPMGYQNYATQFSDVSANAYYFNAVGWAAYFGITSGTSTGQFSPNAVVKNKETVTFIYKAVQSHQITCLSTTAGSLSNLNADPSAWYYSACVWANNQGYLACVPEFENEFQPNSNTTRAIAIYLLWELKTGSCKVSLSVNSGTGITTVTLSGRTGNQVSGYYTKGATFPVSCMPSSGYEFDRWMEGGQQIGTHNPSAITANGNRTWIAVGKQLSPIEVMIQSAEAECGNHQSANPGYNINADWCAAFSSWCAYTADLASYNYVTIAQYSTGTLYYYTSNLSTPINYTYPVLRHGACTQQVAHFCEQGHMYVSRSVYQGDWYSEGTGGWNWSNATLYTSSFTPKRGDFVFFDWNNTDCYANHVGIITAVERNGNLVTITSVEGNINGNGSYNNSVVGFVTRTYNAASNSLIVSGDHSNNGYILGFGRIG
ncbi:MAG: S-layer homology domain-containing protein [Oscillospiraceae bacterium]|nr:S-layer homology domain-containing protein [Oscillospiraceae bacterium]